MRQQEIKCDICGKQLGVEVTPMPNEVDYWFCQPVDKKNGASIYAVLTTPKEPLEICDDCFQDTLHEVHAKSMQRINQVMSKVAKANCCVDHASQGTPCDHE